MLVQPEEIKTIAIRTKHCVCKLKRLLFDDAITKIAAFLIVSLGQ